MMTDIEIAQGCHMRPITEIAAAAGIDEKYIEQYGRYKAKIDLSIMDRGQKGQRKACSCHRHNAHPGRRGKNDHHDRSCRRT